MKNVLGDLKVLAAHVFAGISTLLGMPVVLAGIDPYLVAAVQHLYPDFFTVIYWAIKIGVYILSYALIQTVAVLVITAVSASISALFFQYRQ